MDFRFNFTFYFYAYCFTCFMKEIVCAQVGTIITNDLREIFTAIMAGIRFRFFSRDEMQFMTNFDLGKHYEVMASGPTLFIIDDDGKYKWPYELKGKNEII